MPDRLASEAKNKRPANEVKAVSVAEMNPEFSKTGSYLIFFPQNY